MIMTKHLNILTSIIKDHTQDQPFTVKNPKLDSNSALAKKRRAKGGPLPQLQEQLTQESMEGVEAAEGQTS